MSQTIATITPSSVNLQAMATPLVGSERKGLELFDEIPTLEPPAPAPSRLSFKDNPFIIYVILTLVVLISCFVMFQKSRQTNLKSRRSANCPKWLDDPKIIYPLISVCGLLAGYAAYSTDAKISAPWNVGSSPSQRHAMWVGFAIQIVFLITWFYYTYVKPSETTAYYLAASFLLASVVLTFGVGAITYDPRAIAASFSTVLLGFGITIASLRSTRKTP